MAFFFKNVKKNFRFFCNFGESPSAKKNIFANFFSSMLHTSTFRRIPGPLGRNVKFALHTYVRNRVIFHLHPVPSKNIEKRLQNSASKKKFCEKKFFFRRRGFPKIAKKSENFFSHFWRKRPYKHFKTKMGHIGCKMKVWHDWQARKRENRNLLGPPP